MSEILLPVVALGGIGLVLGALLGIAAKAFHIKRNERAEKIEALLPGANCGGCGFAGCAAFAAALAEKNASCAQCAALKPKNKEKIAALLGLAAQTEKPRTARVLCSGTCDKIEKKCDYIGIADCIAAERHGGGDKACRFGCIGLGTCAGVCQFEAIHVENGVARVDEEKCVGCGACVAICPRHIIETVPKSTHPFVQCNSKERGAAVHAVCKTGCVACKNCEKNCPVGAAHIHNNLAVIDDALCTGCGICVEKCPKHIIVR